MNTNCTRISPIATSSGLTGGITSITGQQLQNSKGQNIKLVQNIHITRPFRGNKGNITRFNGPNQNRQNGPQSTNLEGKTVIGTKTVGGQKQEITMANDKLQRNFKSNNFQQSVGHPVRITNPPSNLKVTSRMVGGKEVQLVTPNIGSKTKSGQFRVFRPSAGGTSGQKIQITSSMKPIRGPSVATATFKDPNTSLTGNTGQPVFAKPNNFPTNNLQMPGAVKQRFTAPQMPPPVHVHHQQMNQPRTPVNIRTAVGGANGNNLPTPPKLNQPAKAAGRIKLGSLAKPADKPAEPKKDEPEDISTRQLAESWLHSGSSRKISKKLTDVIKPTINKATEKLLEQAKINDEKATTPKPEEKKKNKGEKFEHIFSRFRDSIIFILIL